MRLRPRSRDNGELLDVLYSRRVGRESPEAVAEYLASLDAGARRQSLRSRMRKVAKHYARHRRRAEVASADASL